MARGSVAPVIVIGVIIAVGCGGEPAPPAPLPPLPPPAPADTERFADSARCGQCHTAGDGDQLRDGAGRDVSPVALWRTSMMALAARDTMYLAVVSDELADAADPAAVGALCTGVAVAGRGVAAGIAPVGRAISAGSAVSGLAAGRAGGLAAGAPPGSSGAGRRRTSSTAVTTAAPTKPPTSAGIQVRSRRSR